MRLLKIGTDATCDIILNSEYVSSLHSEILILDSGEILLTDKNSKNGTFIGNKKINPNQEYPLRRGTQVMFADVEVAWNKIPKPEIISGYTNIYNIGSNYRNDIVLESQLVSRFHGSLRIKGNKAYIHDNGSKNGTELNGRKIQPHEDVQVKRGDNIVCGDEDVTMQIEPLLPKMGLLKTIIIYLIGIILAFAIGWGISKLISPSVSPESLREAVVYVRAGYHYEISLNDDPVGLNIKLRYPEGSTSYCYEQATAFFIDSEGHMGTNRHVALPWEYRNSEEDEKLHQLFEEYMAQQLTVDIVHLDDYNSLRLAWKRLNSTPLGRLLLAGCSNVDELNARLSRYRRAQIEIKGVMDYMTVGYPGRHYTHIDEFQRCYVVASSDNAEKDVAILQLNDKTTPSNVKSYFNIEDAETSNLKPLADRLFTIGYPNGIEWGLDQTSKSLEPNIRETKCSKEPSKYTFEFQEPSIEGASGSPVFNKEGHLVGILSSGYKGASTIAVKAHYLKELYFDNVNR